MPVQKKTVEEVKVEAPKVEKKVEAPKTNGIGEKLMQKKVVGKNALGETLYEG